MSVEYQTVIAYGFLVEDADHPLMAAYLGWSEEEADDIYELMEGFAEKFGLSSLTAGDAWTDDHLDYVIGVSLAKIENYGFEFLAGGTLKDDMAVSRALQALGIKDRPRGLYAGLYCY